MRILKIKLTLRLSITLFIFEIFVILSYRNEWTDLHEILYSYTGSPRTYGMLGSRNTRRKSKRRKSRHIFSYVYM